MTDINEPYLQDTDRLHGPLDQYCSKTKSKWGFSPLIPEYATRHRYGALMGVANNLVPAFMAQAGYEGCEIILQNDKKDFVAVNHFVDSLDKNISDTLHYQGSDYFAGAWYTQTYGALVMESIRIGAHMLAPTSKATKFIEKNYRVLRSVVGFAMLTGHEISQMPDQKGQLDYKDLFAYAAGIITITHGQQIVNGIANGFKQAKEFIFGSSKKDDTKTPRPVCN